ETQLQKRATHRQQELNRVPDLEPAQKDPLECKQPMHCKLPNDIRLLFFFLQLKVSFAANIIYQKKRLLKICYILRQPFFPLIFFAKSAIHIKTLPLHKISKKAIIS